MRAAKSMSACQSSRERASVRIGASPGGDRRGEGAHVDQHGFNVGSDVRPGGVDRESARAGPSRNIRSVEEHALSSLRQPVGEPGNLKVLLDLGVGVSEEVSGFVHRRSDLDGLSEVGGAGGTHDVGTIAVPAPSVARAGGEDPHVVSPGSSPREYGKWLSAGLRRSSWGSI